MRTMPMKRINTALCALLFAAAIGARGEVNPQREPASRPQGFPDWQASTQPVLKQYPAFRLAKADGRVFDPLFQHISQREIPMTAPVLYVLDTDEAYPEKTRIAATAFLYPSMTTGEPGYDGDVCVEDWDRCDVLSLGFTGAYDLRTLREKVEIITSRCHGRGADYARVGPYRVLSYDGPDIPDALRRHEVQAPVMTRDAWREYYLGRERPAPQPMSPAVEEALEALATIADDWGKPENLAEYERREKASRMLKWTDDEPALQTPADLAKMVRSGKRSEILRALGTLVRLQDDRMVEPLVAMLEHPYWQLRSEAAGGLATLGDKRAVPILIAAMEKEAFSSQSYGRAASTGIAVALAKLGDDRAVQPMRRVFAYLRDRHKPPFAQRIKTQDGTYVTLTWPGFKLALALLGADEFLPTVRAVARDISMSPKAGIDALVAMKDQQALDILVEQLGGDSWGLRRWAAMGLAELGDERAIPHLEKLRDDDHEQVRAAVGWALEQLGGE